MQAHGEPDPRLASSHLHGNPERLRDQALLSWPKEFDALRRLGLRDGTSVLDAGCGPGFISRSILGSLPATSVTAVDLDADMLALAGQHLQDFEPGRFTSHQASILDTDLPDGCVDFAIARYLFQHLSAPELAAEEILRVLKPGGTLAIIDVDDGVPGVVTPYFPQLGQVSTKVHGVQAARGGDRFVGRKLHAILQQAGFERICLEAIVFHSDELGLQAFAPQMDADRFRPFVAPGGLTEREWESYSDAVEAFRASPAAFILQVNFLASGIKPG